MAVKGPFRGLTLEFTAIDFDDTAVLYIKKVILVMFTSAFVGVDTAVNNNLTPVSPKSKTVIVVAYCVNSTVTIEGKGTALHTKCAIANRIIGHTNICHKINHKVLCYIYGRIKLNIFINGTYSTFFNRLQKNFFINVNIFANIAIPTNTSINCISFFIRGRFHYFHSISMRRVFIDMSNVRIFHFLTPNCAPK